MMAARTSSCTSALSNAPGCMALTKDKRCPSTLLPIEGRASPPRKICAPSDRLHCLEVVVPARRHFQLVLVKPSHYDDDGYVIRWWRAMIPSNSLAAVYSIAADCAERQVLGTDVAIDIEAIDEPHTRVNVSELLERFRRHGNFGLLALVGVQSNQYPRALDIARPFRTAGIPAAIGGFHDSGWAAILVARSVEPHASLHTAV